MRELPSLESLRCFVEAARQGSFRRAAEQVHLTPAAVSQRMRQLEDLLGGPLFRRTTRAMALTPLGTRLLPVAETTLKQAERCLEVSLHDEGKFLGEIVVGTRHELGMSWVEPLLRGFKREQPDLTIHLYFGSGTDLIARLATREVDCAITSNRLVDPRLAAVTLHPETYTFVASPKLLADRPLRTAADASSHELCDVSPDLPLFRYFRDAEGGLDSLKFGSILRLGTIDAIRSTVLGGRGVAVLPTYFVKSALAERRLVRVFPKVKVATDHFRLVTRAGDPRGAIFAWLGDRLRRAPLR